MPGALHPGAEKRQHEARNERLESGARRFHSARTDLDEGFRPVWLHVADNFGQKASVPIHMR